MGLPIVSVPQEGICVEKFRVSYGDHVVIQSAYLVLEPGQLVLVTGPNGCGKSTLLKGLMGLIRHVDGRLWVDGKDINGIPPHRRALVYGLGYFPQHHRVFPSLSVRENLDAVRRANKDCPDGGMDPLEILPEVRPLLQKRAGEMSGGEQSLAGLAVLLATSPRWLLLDEPTAGLAPELAQDVWYRLVRQLNGCVRGIIAVEHEEDIVPQVVAQRYGIEDGVLRTVDTVRFADRKSISEVS